MTAPPSALRHAFISAAVSSCIGAAAPAAIAAIPARLVDEASAARASREADRPLYWIRQLGGRPAAGAGGTSTGSPSHPVRAKPARVASSAASPGVVASTASEHVAAAGSPPSRPTSPPSPVGTAPPAATPANPANVVPGATVHPVVATAEVSEAARRPRPAAIAPTASAPAPPPASAPVPVGARAGAAAVTRMAETPDAGLVIVRSVDPDFPMAVMRRLRKGEVRVRVDVGADGRVSAAQVLKSTHHGLDAAALDAARQWQFKPAPRATRSGVVALAFDLDA